MTKYEDYAEKFQMIRFRREDGILEMRLHTNGDSLRMNLAAHAEMEQAFLDIGRDPENQVIIFTGTGAEFTGPAIVPGAGRPVPKLTPEQWMKLGSEAKRFTMNL